MNGVLDPVPAHPNVRQLLRKYDLRPDKRYGQNFLTDAHALEKVVQAAGLQGDEAVLEIGAGLGSLTCWLAQSARRVVAVELDERLLPALIETVQGRSNVQVITGDILKLDVSKLFAPEPYVVVANIPYNITSALIRQLIETPHRGERLVLTVQREVAERILAEPGTMNLLALSVQLFGEPEITAHIPAGAFFPKPKVDSAVLRIRFHPEPRAPLDLVDPFFCMARAGFRQKRKKLRNSLAALPQMNKDQLEGLFMAAGLSPDLRPQQLSVEDWVTLADLWMNAGED